MSLLKLFIKTLLIFSVIFFISATLLLKIFIKSTNNYYAEQVNYKSGVEKRKYPYPYKAAIAICSDIDGTDTAKEFLAIQEFMNTDNFTKIGMGVNLEIGNSFFPVAKYDRFAFISKNPYDTEVIIDFIQKGYIDFIHSFNAAKNRNEILEIIEKFKKNNCSVDVWVNHARAPNDIGPKKWCLGDNPSSEHYHTDVTVGGKNGVRFVWTGAVSSILGQGVPLTYQSFLFAHDKDHFVKSMYNNVIKEFIKYYLSYIGDKYSYRKKNELIYPIKLDDDKMVYGFVRNNISYKGIRRGSYSNGMADIFKENYLNKLIEVGAVMIVYTHFGQNSGPPYLDSNTAKALRLLADRYRSGHIYVTTTSKLLNYYVNNKYLEWKVVKDNSKIKIYIEKVADPINGAFIPTINDIQGVSFSTKDIKQTEVYLAGNKIFNIEKFYDGDRQSGTVMIPLIPLPEAKPLFKKFKKKVANLTQVSTLQSDDY